jgi:hypothetical protein
MEIAQTFSYTANFPYFISENKSIVARQIIVDYRILNNNEICPICETGFEKDGISPLGH